MPFMILLCTMTKIFAGLLLWIFYVFVLSCVCYVFVHVCLYVLCGHLLGKSWPLGSRLWRLTVSLSLSHWFPGSGVVLDCIDSWSLHPYLLLWFSPWLHVTIYFTLWANDCVTLALRCLRDVRYQTCEDNCVGAQKLSVASRFINYAWPITVPGAACQKFDIFKISTWLCYM